MATQLAAADIERSRSEGTARIEQLAKARILAQRARTDETLQLIARGDITAGEKSFQATSTNYSPNSRPGRRPRVTGIQRWTASHQKHVQAYLGGDYPAAVSQAIGSDPGASAAQFGIVEAGLRDGVEETRDTLRERVSTAGACAGVEPDGDPGADGVAGAATLGLWPRLKEFL